jgi:signal transduction histidine kinase
MKRIVQGSTEKGALTNDSLFHMSRLIMLGELMACFAHDLTSPLMLIRGHLRLMGENVPANHPVRIDFDAIDRASRRIEEMTKSILDFSRKRSVRAEGCEPKALIDEALRFVQPYLQARRIEVQVNASAHLPHIQVDRWSMVQALVNLFQNAADAMSESQRRVLTVALDHAMNFLRITVSDTGHGIQPGDLRQVFNPFFTTKGERGTGLGLYIARRVIEEHRGTITVQSADCGATFIISLPV